MILAAHQLSKHYAAIQALDRVSLHLEAGEVVGFLGPNGAGKSTTMKILTGYLSPSGGSATINGHDLLREPLACRRQVGYLPQQLPLYPDMRVSAYLDHVARLKGIDRHERRRVVVEAIEQCALAEVAERHLRKLSGGNQQRVGLAQALLGRPPILILDEPTAGLDPAQVARLRALLKDLAGRHSILLSTHVMAEVEACCSRVVMIHRGRVIVEESMASLQERTRRLSQVAVRLQDPAQLPACRQALLSALPGCALHIDGERLVVTCPPELRAQIVACVQAHGGLRELVEQRRSLEEVFAELVEKGQAA